MRHPILFTLGVILLFLACAAPGFAQTDLPPTEFRIRLYQQGSTVVAWESPSVPIQPPVTTCGLEPRPAATGIVVNPTLLQFDDPNAAGKACTLPLNLGGAAAIPDGVYELSLIGVRGSVVSPKESEHVLLAKGPITIRVFTGVVVLP